MNLEKKIKTLESRLNTVERLMEVGVPVKQTPRFRVGDYAVYIGDGYIEYVKINCIHISDDGTYHYDAYDESERLREPTEEEMIYFR